MTSENFSPDYCIECKKEMRKWITRDIGCVSMCINPKCNQNGIVNRTIQNIRNIKLEFSFKF